MGRHHEALRFQRIKDALQEWAGYMVDNKLGGYPKQAPFATERVQSSNRSTETLTDAVPDRVVQLNMAIEALAPTFKRVIGLEYCYSGPQKVKADKMGIGRTLFAYHLAHVHEHLEHVMYGASVQQNPCGKIVQQQVS